jgi:hypothetical protein
MADTVNLSLENAVREAEELEKSGSFTRAEVKYIFQKRARFEYLLKRRRAPAARFLKYIKFETDLYKLHKLRKVLLPRASKVLLLIYFKTQILSQEQPSAGSNQAIYNAVAHGFIRKVHSLYQRALRKFRGSVGLWLEFTIFCYSHGNQRLLSEVISQALRLNPSCAGLWAFAASWEYKRKARQKHSLLFSGDLLGSEHHHVRIQQGDISAARYLLLRGLRNCNQSKGRWPFFTASLNAGFLRGEFSSAVLWHGYFRLEMLYAADLNTRRQILGASEDAANNKMVRALFLSFFCVHKTELPALALAGYGCRNRV